MDSWGRIYIRPWSLNHVFWTYIYVRGIERVNLCFSQVAGNFYEKFQWQCNQGPKKRLCGGPQGVTRLCAWSRGIKTSREIRQLFCLFSFVRSLGNTVQLFCSLRRIRISLQWWQHPGSDGLGDNEHDNLRRIRRRIDTSTASRKRTPKRSVPEIDIQVYSEHSRCVLSMIGRQDGQRRRGAKSRADGDEPDKASAKAHHFSWILGRVHSATRWPVRLPRLLQEVRYKVPRTVRSTVGGKRESRSSLASVTAGSLTLHDAKLNRAFLIDTGAEVSVVPATEHERHGAPMQKELVAANGSRIRCYGDKKLRLNVGPRVYEWKFLVADVRRPLIGADFLTHSSLMVNLRNKRLVHPEELNATSQQRTRRKAQITGLAFAETAKPSPLAMILAEIPSFTTPNFKIDQDWRDIRIRRSERNNWTVFPSKRTKENKQNSCRISRLVLIPRNRACRRVTPWGNRHSCSIYFWDGDKFKICGLSSTFQNFKTCSIKIGYNCKNITLISNEDHVEGFSKSNGLQTNN